MLLYYNRKMSRFDLQRHATKSPDKIHITAEALEANKIGTYGPAELPGQYISRIDGIEFYWDDLQETLVSPEWDIKVWAQHPRLGISALIDR